MGSSVAAFVTVLIPSLGVAAASRSQSLVADISYQLWLSTLVAALSSLGAPAILGQRWGQAAAEGDLAGAQDFTGALLAWQLGIVTLVSLALAAFGPSPVSRSIYLQLAFVGFSYAAAVQLTLTSVLGGVLENERLLVANAIAGGLLGISLVLAYLTLNTATVLVTASALVARAVALWAFARPRLRFPTLRTALSLKARDLAAPYAWTIMTVLLWQKTELYFLERRGTVGDMTQYSIAYDISIVVKGASTSAFAILIPVFAFGLGTRMVAHSIVRLRRAMYVPTALVSCLLIATAMAMSASKGSIGELWGPDSQLLLVVLLAGAGVAAASGPVAAILLGWQQYRPFIAAAAVSSVGLVILEYRYLRGPIGASVLSTLGQATFFFLCVLFSRAIGGLAFRLRLLLRHFALLGGALTCALVIILAGTTSKAALGLGLVGLAWIGMGVRLLFKDETAWALEFVRQSLGMATQGQTA